MVFTEQILNCLLNIIPVWSSNIVLIFGLGNEYTVALNLILTQILKLLFLNINDLICIVLLTVCFIAYALKHFGYTNYLKIINIYEKKIIILYGIETENTVFYSNKINLINYYLINIVKVNNICFQNDVTILINDCSNLKIHNNIYLNIARYASKTNDIKVRYVLWSYKDDINTFLNYLEDTYKNINNSQLKLLGDETDNQLNYPVPIHALNYHIALNYDFPKLKCCMTKQNNTLPDVNMKENEEKKDNNTFSYTIDDITNFKLFKDKLLLTIYREKNVVYYNLKSEDNTVNCKEWIEKIVTAYNCNLSKELKQKIILLGQEVIWYGTTDFKKYFYSKAMWAINWYVIEQLNYQHYECVNGDKNLVLYNYILEPFEFLELEPDLFLTIKKNKCNKRDEHKEYNTNTDVIYILYSNEKNIRLILDKYIQNFEKFNKKETSNLKLFHFTYNGLKDNNLVFTTKLLSEENTANELFETFDKLHNENVEIIKRDIDKLKDLEYYKKHGLKRKKGYLFHGIPGCGKTSTVVSMALYDKRHIIEIPFSLITKHDEFEKIMNLSLINNIEVNNNNIILLFDEIDIGMNGKIEKRTDELNQNQNQILDIIESTKFKTKDDLNTTNQKINLGTLLSKLDGISNYNGLIIVATTNFIDKLDPALYRDLRLSPIKFQHLRKIDCIQIIQSYFGSYDLKYNDIIKDRLITPTKLIALCQKHENEQIDVFFKTILNEYF